MESVWPGPLIIIIIITVWHRGGLPRRVYVYWPTCPSQPLSVCMCVRGSRFTSRAHPRAPPCSLSLSLVSSLLLERHDNAAYGSIAGVATPGSLPPSFHSIQFRSASGYYTHTHIYTQHTRACARTGAYRRVHKQRQNGAFSFRTREKERRSWTSNIGVAWRKFALGSLTLCETNRWSSLFSLSLSLSPSRVILH